MSIKKKLTLITLMVVSVFCLVFGAVACNGSAKQAVEMYLLPQAQTLVSEDFSLPKKIGKDDSVTVEWKSSNTDAISIEDAGDKYTAKVTLQDEVTDVTLTISAGGASKDFVVRVDELTVYTFLDRYEFPQMNTAQKSDFDLDTEMTVQGKKATITWSIESQYAEFIQLNEAKNKVLVSPVEDIKSVKIKATFSYGEDTASQDYPFSVAPPLEHRQLVNRMYSVAGYPIDFSGYIVHVYEASESYGNATFYAIDDDFCSGYYFYRVKIDTSKIDKFVAGAHVTVSNDTTKNYNGLWENNSGGTATVDDKTPIDPREKVYALDTDLLAGAPSLLWRESTFVSLSGWKVASKPENKPTGADSNLLTLQRGDTKITIRVSKYIQRTDDELTALLNVYDSVNVDDYVNVTGILGCYNTAGGFDVSKFQLQPILASDITKVTAEGTNTDGAKVKAAIAKVDAEVQKNFGGIVTADKEVTMPTSEGDVTISYRVAGENLQDPTVTVNGGKISVKPVTTEKNYDIEVTYSIGDYKAYGFFKIHNWKKSDSELVETVKAALEKLELETVTTAGEVTFPTLEETYGATITWELGTNAPAWITEKGGKITVTALPDEETTVTVVANITLGEAKGSVKLTLTVAAAPTEVFKALEEPAAGTYKLAMYNGSTKKTYYALGTMANTYYYGTTEDPSQAADFVIEQVGSENKYTIKINGKYLEFAARESGTQGVDIKMNDTQTAGKYWQWNNAIKNFVFESTYNKGDDPAATETDLYYLGNYSTNTTMSGNYIGRIADKSGDTYTAKENTEGVSQWVAHFGNMVTASAADKLNEAKNALELDTSALKEVGDEVDLPATGLYGATIAWTLPEEDTYLEIANGKLSVKALPEEGSQTIAVTATITLGTETPVTKEFTVTLRAPAKPGANDGSEEKPFTVADVKEIGETLANKEYYEDGKKVYIKGFVTAAGKINGTYGLSNVYIADVAGDSDSAVQVYSINWGGVMTRPDPIPTDSPLTVGDQVVIYGFIEVFNDKVQITYKNPTDDPTGTNPIITAWTKAGTTEPEPGPEPEPELSQPTKGTEIVTEGATVFDFSNVQVAADNDYSEMTEEAILTAFGNPEGLTVTKSKVYAGNNNASGPSDYQKTGGFLRMGSSSANGTLTLTFTKDITKVQILCLGWSATDTIAIDGFEPATIGNTAQVAYTYTLTDAVKSFTITTAKRALIFKIAVTFADGSTVDPEPAEHVHNYTYTYDTEIGWQHKGHCDVAGCNQADITVACTPVLNVCPDCDHTFTQDEILTKLFASQADSTMSGTYSLTGKVLRIDTPYDNTQFYNVTFTIKVGDKEIQCYREKSTYSANVKPGDTVTVQGTLKHYYNGTKEFDGGCQITNLTAGELTDEEKIAEALRVVTLPASTAEDITLPTPTISGVQFEWASDTEASISVEDGKLKVTQKSEQVTVKITLTASCGATATATKEFTIIVDAKIAEGSEKAELKYSGSTTGNMTDGNNAATLGADANIFTVTSEKTNEGKNHVGLNKDGTMRLYKGETATLHIEVASAYTIVSIKVTLASASPAKISYLKVVVGTATITGTGINDAGTVATFAVNGTKVSLSNTYAGDQMRISSIEVVYAPVAAGPTADDGFHFDKGVSNLIGTWSSEDGYKIVVTETTFLFTDPEGQKCTYTVTETASGALYTHSILWQGKTYKLDTPTPNKLVFLDGQTESYTFTKESSGTVSFPESLRGTYTCVDVESEDGIEAEDVAQLTITESGITWNGEATDFEGNIEQMLNFTINGEHYMAMYQMGMLMIRDSEGNTYTFMNMSGGAGGGVGGLM